jgi:nucleoside-diphosphate-sugar epimerase/predicted dehydrogenase
MTSLSLVNGYRAGPFRPNEAMGSERTESGGTRRNVRIGLIGCGNIARSHIAALQSVEDARIVGVYDRDRFRAQAAADSIPGHVVVATDVDELLAAELDVVHVLTAPDSHRALAVRVLETGVHAFVEKPMALTEAHADEMLQVAREHGVKLGTCHNYLFKPSVLAARRLVEEGAIGDVVHVHAFYGMAGEGASTGSGAAGHWAWRLPGGVFANVLPHLISLQQDVLGDITGVSRAFTHDGPHGPSELTVLVDGRDASGSLTVSVRARPYAKYVDIFGTKGTVRADLVREICVVHKERKIPRMASKALYGLEEAAQLCRGTAVNVARVLTGRMGNMPELPATFREFYASIETGRDSVLSGEHGRAMASVLEQIAKQVPPHQPHVVSHAGPASAAEREFVAQAGTPRVLVTGAGGFLGSRLVGALARCGAGVVAAVHDPSRVTFALESQAEVIALELRDPARVADAMRDVDIVFHCAAVTANNVSWAVQYETNVMGTAAVLDAAVECDVGRVVHVSSVSVYGSDLKGDSAVDESAPYGDEDDESAVYARSKREADALALRRALDDGVPVTVVRLGILYGPGNTRPIERGLVQVGRFRLAMGSGGNTLPFTYVANAVDALLLAAVSPQAVGQAFNIVDPPAWSVRETAQRAARAAGEPVVLVPVSARLLDLAARGLEARGARRGRDSPPRLSRYVVTSATRSRIFDTTKAERELGWTPEVSPEAALDHSNNL